MTLEWSKTVLLFSLKSDISIYVMHNNSTYLSLHSTPVLLVVVMNGLTLSLIYLLLLQNPPARASFQTVLKLGLDGLDHLVHSRNSLSSILFPDSAESKNITVKLGFIGALDKSLGATATLGHELVSLWSPQSTDFKSLFFQLCTNQWPSMRSVLLSEFGVQNRHWAYQWGRSQEWQ